MKTSLPLRILKGLLLCSLPVFMVGCSSATPAIKRTAAARPTASVVWTPDVRSDSLKNIYLAPSAELAAEALDSFATELDQKYSMIAKSWRSRWNEVIPFFKFSPDVRKAVYTTNAIESVNFTIQKIIKHRQSFPNDEAAMKLIFMGLKNIARKWTMPIRDWGAALNQFAIIYGEDRVPL